MEFSFHHRAPVSPALVGGWARASLAAERMVACIAPWGRSLGGWHGTCFWVPGPRPCVVQPVPPAWPLGFPGCGRVGAGPWFENWIVDASERPAPCPGVAGVSL